jgi:hypothetical protein
MLDNANVDELTKSREEVQENAHYLRMITAMQGFIQMHKMH